MYTGPHIIKDGLVFGYDTGFPVVSGSSDTYRFNKGEPTENLFPEPNYTITDGQVLNHIEFTRKPGQGYNGLHSLEGVVSSSYISGQIQRRYTLNLAQGFHTHSFYVKKNCDFFRIEHLGTAQLTSGGATQQQFKVNPTTGIITPSSGFTDYDIEDVGDWWKVWYKIEISGTGNAIFDYEPVYGIGKRFEICGSQIEAKSHSTPFTDSTRSVTESLIDLKQTTDIDLSNVSFNSNAQMIFDGTDDRIELGDQFDIADYFIDNQSFTIEAVVNLLNTDTNSNGGIFSNQKYQSQTDAPGFGLCIRRANNTLYYCMNIVEVDNSIQTSYEALAQVAANIGNLEHVTYVYDNNTSTIYAYINGELANSQTNSNFNWSLPTDTTRTKIGTSTQGGWGYYHEMDLPVVKCYNKALTSAEVSQNYNALKNRFSL